MVKIILLAALLVQLHAAVVETQDGIKHYLPDAAKRLTVESFMTIPHIMEKEGYIYAYDKNGIKVSAQIEPDIPQKFIENFKNIFYMQTGGKKEVDRIVSVKTVPHTNIQMVVYILNGLIIPAYATEDGKRMFQYSPIVDGHGFNRFEYSYMIQDIAMVQQFGQIVSGESRYAKLALKLQGKKDLIRINKGKGVKDGEYYFADPMCPLCIQKLQTLQKEPNTDTTIVLVPAMRPEGLQSIMRAAAIVEEIHENNITSPEQKLSVLIKYFGDSSYPTGAMPQKKYIDMVRFSMAEFLPVTQNNVPFVVPYKEIEKLSKKLAFATPKEHKNTDTSGKTQDSNETITKHNASPSLHSLAASFSNNITSK